MDLAQNKNKGFKTFLKMYGTINNEYETDEKYVNITLNLGQIASFKYGPTTSWDVTANINLFFNLITGGSH
jgi:hypothetical protein